MRTHHRLDVSLTLIGPILTHGSDGAPGIDAPMARDSQGRFLLPFSLIKGKVVDALRELRPADPKVKDWLGQATPDGTWEPERGRLRFSDFITQVKGAGQVIERIQINQDTGSTAGQMLMMTEAPFGYGEEVLFTGTIEFIAEAKEAGDIRDTLDVALKWVPAYGAFRTVGFGRTHKVEVTLAGKKQTSTGNPTGDTLHMRLQFDRPLCLVGKKHSRNHFDSLECVPGSVLKGATARLLLELSGSKLREVSGEAPEGCTYPHLWKYLAEIRFAEAKPMKQDSSTRPIEPPLSLVCVKDGDKDYSDVALCDGARLIKNQAPAFAPDWKYDDERKVRQDFGWPSVKREVRTRTAIDAEKGRAKDQQLFSYGLVIPDELAWESSIGLDRVPVTDRAAVRTEMAKLFSHGLPNVGKTRAVATVTWLGTQTPSAQATKDPETGEHVVTMQTDFLMTDPDLLTSGCHLKLVYQAYFDDVAPGQFKLERFFAKQSLQGGHLAKRYSKIGTYEPYLLTERGSTFVLKVIGTVAEAKLKEWTLNGLPLPRWAVTRYAQAGKELWQTCPFLPENGFGEVVIDLACHTENRP